MFHGDLKKSLFLSKQTHRARIKGIGSGIGKYQDGTLTLSRADIASVMGPTQRKGRGTGAKRVK